MRCEELIKMERSCRRLSELLGDERFWLNLCRATNLKKAHARSWRWTFLAHNLLKPEKTGLGYCPKIRYAGEWKDGLMDGYGIRYEEDNVYDGEWKAGKRRGFGISRWIDGGKHVGQWNILMNGHGRYEWPDGQIYTGMMKNGWRSGFGRYEWPRGDTYVGNFEHGARNGIGNYTWADNRHYSGYWREHLRDTLGCYTWPDGSVYIGGWLNSKRHGHGAMCWPDNGCFEGEWKNDRPVDPTFPNRTWADFFLLSVEEQTEEVRRLSKTWDA